MLQLFSSNSSRIVNWIICRRLFFLQSIHNINLTTQWTRYCPEEIRVFHSFYRHFTFIAFPLSTRHDQILCTRHVHSLWGGYHLHAVSLATRKFRLCARHAWEIIYFVERLQTFDVLTGCNCWQTIWFASNILRSTHVKSVDATTTTTTTTTAATAT